MPVFGVPVFGVPVFGVPVFGVAFFGVAFFGVAFFGVAFFDVAFFDVAFFGVAFFLVAFFLVAVFLVMFFGGLIDEHEAQTRARVTHVAVADFDHRGQLDVVPVTWLLMEEVSAGVRLRGSDHDVTPELLGILTQVERTWAFTVYRRGLALRRNIRGWHPESTALNQPMVFCARIRQKILDKLDMISVQSGNRKTAHNCSSQNKC